MNEKEFTDGEVIGDNDDVELEEALVLQRFFANPIPVRTNVPHLVTHHSPSGFEFGYGGSGAADLALNVCEWYLNKKRYTGRKTECWKGSCWSLAYALHQDFKWEFIASAPKDGCVIPYTQIESWFEKRMDADTLRAHAHDDENAL